MKVLGPKLVLVLFLLGLAQARPAAASVLFAFPTVATCVNGGSANHTVVATGTTGVAPDSQDTQVVTVICAAPTPARPSTWGAIKSIYRA